MGLEISTGLLSFTNPDQPQSDQTDPQSNSISHHPVRMANQADSTAISEGQDADWTIHKALISHAGKQQTLNVNESYIL